MPNKVVIAVAMACFNRRDKTLRCLRSLMQCNTENVSIRLHIVDDGSSDGTAEAILAEFPQAYLLQGSGSLFWGGGMRAAMGSAIQHPFDYILWLNDDVTLQQDAIQRLLTAYSSVQAVPPGLHVIAGAMREPGSSRLSYGGFNRRNAWNPASLSQIGPSDDAPTRCDTFNGNCVLIPAAVAATLGPNDAAYPHQLGDIDYGYRLARAGGQVWLAPGFVGECASNPRMSTWHNARGIMAKLKLLNSPLGLPPKAWLTFMYRWAGIPGVAVLGVIYLRALSAKPRQAPPR
jgi:GT2 family glycosyltransferase